MDVSTYMRVDCYFEESVKIMTRDNKSRDGSRGDIYHVQSDWIMLLSRAENKE